MVIFLGKYEFRLKKVKDIVVTEQYGAYGKIAESKTFVQFGWEESFHFGSYFLVIGKYIGTVRKWSVAQRPDWAKVLTVPPPPPKPVEPGPNVLPFKGKK